MGRASRRAVVASVGTVLVAGCSGGDGGTGGSDGSDGSNGGEGDEGGDGTPPAVGCAEFGSASLVPYDVAGTALPCTFEYPEPLQEQSALGEPAIAVTFQGRVGEGAVVMTVQLADQDEGRTEDQVTSDSPEESFDYGDRTGYLIRVTEPSARIPRSQFTAMVPFETEGEVLYYGVIFAAQYSNEAEEDPSEECLTALDEVVQATLETVGPNPDTEFGSTLEGG